VIIHQDINGTQARIGTIEPTAEPAANHQRATSSWLGGPV
jgi:hypothetical protein